MAYPNWEHDFYFEYKNVDQDINTIISVYLRPGYKDFLSYLKNNTETVLYTRFQRDLIEQIFANIDPQLFDFI